MWFTKKERKFEMNEDREDFDPFPFQPWKRPCTDYLFSLHIPKLIKKKLNIPSPAALTCEGWNDYDHQYKKHYPWMYWFENTLMDKIQNIFCYLPKKIRDVKYYLVNRFIDRTHMIKTGLKKGQYHEFDEKILHGLFTEFLSKLEEIGRFNQRVGVVSDEPVDYPAKELTLIDHAVLYLRFQQQHCEKDSEAYQSYEDIIALKNWWLDTRPKRPDPYQVYTYHHSLSGLFLSNEGLTDEQKEQNVQTSKVIIELEQLQQDEDTQMMIKLIKVRSSLWC